jgi:hypothetical protein
MDEEGAIEVVDLPEGEDEEDDEADVLEVAAQESPDTPEPRDVHERLASWQVVAAKGKSNQFWKRFGV